MRSPCNTLYVFYLLEGREEKPFILTDIDTVISPLCVKRHAL